MATAGDFFYTCGLDGAGAIHCWGYNGSEQLSPLSGNYAKLSVGGPNACVLDARGMLGCWGATDGGLFTPPKGSFTQTDGGIDFSCALKTDQTIVCWGGANEYQQRDAGEVPSGRFKQLSVGLIHACAIKSDDTVICWGGRYLDDSDVLQRYPRAVAPTGTFKAISAGYDLTCGDQVGRHTAMLGRDEPQSPDRALGLLHPRRRWLFACLRDQERQVAGLLGRSAVLRLRRRQHAQRHRRQRQSHHDNSAQRFTSIHGAHGR